ncbi:hypothetical protein MIR68_010469 [Amoeboaphelidium protococcarum]|nr:hypothetical protein MIR68_010469 [Amoeboaphelidium protococcarum]
MSLLRVSRRGFASAAAESSAWAKPQPNDVVIVSALRTPMTRARKGGFKDTTHEELLSFALKGILDKTGVKPSLVEDIQVGNVLPPGGGATLARMSMLHAGFPDTSSVCTINRQCSSGLQAVANIAAAIQTGVIEIGIGGGVESMTQHYTPDLFNIPVSKSILSNKQAKESLMAMGTTSENVVAQFKITREEQDKFAVSSHEKASRAQKSGYFKDEIIPCSVGGAQLSEDDGIRHGTTYEGLSKLKPAFKENGTTTAGNASQVTDGAAAVLLMKRSKAQQLGLPIVGKWISFAVAGVPPHIMGIGPAFAIPKALKKAGLGVNDIDIYEINEAFASQCVQSIKTLNIPYEKVNPKGGAIALGHPLGATGARQIATLLPELKRTGKKLGVVSMCIGTGMGAAAVIRAESA